MRAFAQSLSGTSGRHEIPAVPSATPSEKASDWPRSGFALVAWLGFGIYLLCLSLLPGDGGD